MKRQELIDEIRINFRIANEYFEEFGDDDIQLLSDIQVLKAIRQHIGNVGKKGVAGISDTRFTHGSLTQLKKSALEELHEFSVTIASNTPQRREEQFQRKWETFHRNHPDVSEERYRQMIEFLRTREGQGLWNSLVPHYMVSEQIDYAETTYNLTWQDLWDSVLRLSNINPPVEIETMFGPVIVSNLFAYQATDAEFGLSIIDEAIGGNTDEIVRRALANKF